MKLNKEIREYKTEEYLWVRQGEDCWVELDVDTLPDRDGDVFIRAKIESVDIDKRMVVVSYTDPDFSGSPDVHVTRIFKRDPNVYPELNDLVDMPVLNDAELHQKIRDRFGVLNIFTYIGPSLLIINPFKYIKEQYLESLKKEFYDCIMTPSVHKVREKPPHVWAIAAQAYLDLYNNKLNQACCISGESGAGKTVNTKTCMSFLTGMNDIFGSKTAAADPNEPRIEDKILMCNPILEALGNAKTVRNDNSSRFGKYVSLYMHNKIVIGASVESYLLEAIRVTTPNKSERNYHVFYQFMKGATDEDVNKMKLKRDPKAYLFLEKSGCYEVPTVDDIAEYKDHEKSMKTLNLLGDWRESYWRIICAVLHLSNVKFDDTYFNGSAPCDITTGNVLDDICSVLDVDRPVLEAALTTRTSIVMGKELTIFLDKSNCNSLCESFGKDIYNKLFSWVIKYLNLALLPENEKKSGQDPAKLYQKIGLLDIFGFEIFEHNSIEQLCINFTNEKLHQLYVEYVFKLEVQTFIDEGLKQFLANLSFNDNTEVLELLAHPETKRYSVFNLIDDQSATMAKDQNIVDQFGQFHGKNPKMQFSKTKKNMFFIVHTARAVGYTIDGFCEKNKDEVPRPIIRCVLSSRQKRISDIYCQKIKDSDTPVDYLGEALKKKESFISYKFRQQMDSLMNELRSCQCSFMRCIKPNEAKSATVWTSSLVVLQIRYLGLLDSIKIRKESYPFRFVFKTFVNRYLELEPEHSSKMPAELEALKPDYKQLSRNILKAAIPEHTDKTQLVGSTRVFLKIEAYQNLESAYEKAVKVKKEAVKYLDKALLELKVRTRINEIRRKSQVAVDVINTMIFGMKTKEAKRKFKILRKLVIKMQRNFRMRKALREFRKKRQSLVNIQSAIEAFVAQRKARDKFMAVKTIARYYKNYKLVSSLKWYVELLRLVRDTAKKAVEASIHKHHIKAAITIQKNVRGWLTRLQCEDEVKKIKTAKELFKYDKAIKILRKLVAGKVVRKRVKKIKNAAAKIQAYFKMRWTKHSYNHLRANTIKIQRAVKVWLKRKREKDQKRLKYFSQEYIPFLKKCMRDQSRLYPVDEESLQKTLSKERVNLRAEPPKLHKPYQQTPEFEQNPLHKMRIYSEVIDVDFIKDTFASYRDGWAAGYIDCHKDAMANKTDVRGIEVGGHHTVLSTLNAKIYCWGRNDEHQLGIEGTEETMGVFKITKDEEKLRCLAAGESHSFILTRDRTVFTFGANETGQLGLGHNQNVRKIQVNNVLTKAKLNSIHARAHESYGVTHNGELLFWPLSPSDPSIALLRFPEQEQVSTVSLGYDFAMALTLKGNIYAFGRENQKGQLGLGHTEPVLTPKLVQGPSQERFVQVSCGHSHTLAFTKNSKVYAWGAGNTGQIGLGDTSNYLIPNLVKVGSATCKPIQVCASQRGSYALCETGAIFWWGKNSRVCMLTKPTLFRNPVHPQLIPLQIRSSWSSNINITYVQMGDLRYVEAKTIGQKTALAQQISEKWNSMGQSQCRICCSPSRDSSLSRLQQPPFRQEL